MARSEHAPSPKTKTLRVGREGIGDWLAPVIAFVGVVAVLLSLVSALFESAR